MNGVQIVGPDSMKFMSVCMYTRKKGYLYKLREKT